MRAAQRRGRKKGTRADAGGWRPHGNHCIGSMQPVRLEKLRYFGNESPIPQRGKTTWAAKIVVYQIFP